MKSKLILVLAISMALSACSELATKEAPIEDRVSTGQPVTSSGSAASTAGISETGKPSKDAATAASATPGTAQATIPGQQKLASGQAEVETHGAAAQGVEVRPLPNNMAGGAAGEGSGPGGAQGAAGMAGAQGSGGTAGAGGTPEEILAATYATMQVPPQDPGNPLARRIILFDFDSSVIKDEYRELIEAHALFLKSSTNAKSILQGHTDERGSRDYNLALGQRRAESVQQAMSLMGVDPMRIEAVSLGEEKPVAEEHDESAWSQNRRVEIYYRGE